MAVVVKRALAVMAACVALASCVARPEPAPATLSKEPPPWSAPRDAISHIRAAGLPELPLDTDTDPWIVDLDIELDGERVGIPAHIGVDRLRALQAPVHTHDDSGEVWLEGPGSQDITLGDFFVLWGVRFDSHCLGPACDVEVLADGTPVPDPEELVLRGVARIQVIAAS